MTASGTPTQSTTPLLCRRVFTRYLLAGGLLLLVLLVLFMLDKPGLADPKSAGTFGLWINFLGTLHPVLLHLPIGALVLVMLLEAVGLFSRGKYAPNTLLPLLFTLFTAFLALLFGYCLYLTGNYSGELVVKHKNEAFLFCVLVVVATLFKVATLQFPQRSRAIGAGYLLMLFACGGVMGIAGHHGGLITHGDPMEQLPMTVLAKRAEASEALRGDPVVYEHVIRPILEERCVYCHGPDKQEGNYRMDAMHALLTAGDAATGLVPGDPEKSGIIARLHLPRIDEDHMPPPDKPQPTREEIALLEWWVGQGAPEHHRLSELEKSPGVEEALASLVSPAERKAREKQRKQQEQEERLRILAAKERIRPEMEAFNQDYPEALNFISNEGADLRFNGISYTKSFGREDLDKLLPFAEFLRSANFTLCNLDDGSAETIAKLTSLRELNLGQTGVTDAFIAGITNLTDLVLLNLYGTRITPAGNEHLQKLPSLRTLYLGNTGFDAGQTAALRKILSADRDMPVEVIGMDEMPKLDLLSEEGTFAHQLSQDPKKYGQPIGAATTVTVSSNDMRYSPKEGLKQFTAQNDPGLEFAFHSRNEKRPWVQLSFKSPHRLSAFLLRNRETLPQRADGLELQRRRPNGSWEIIWQSPGPQGKWAVDLSEQAAAQREASVFRFIINRNEEAMLHLSHLALWGHRLEPGPSGPEGGAEERKDDKQGPVAAGPGVGAWDPGRLTGLGLWLDANDVSTITDTSGRVSQWDDKSGKGYHAYALAPNERPRMGQVRVNGKPALAFYESRLASKLPEHGDWRDVFLVADWDGGPKFDNFNGLLTGFAGSLGVIGDSRGAGTGLYIPETWWTRLKINGQSHDGANAMATLAKPFMASITATNATDVTGFSIGTDRRFVGAGNRRDWEGAVCEIIGYNRTLADAERHRVEGYLAHKWGLVAILPNDHPYKTKGP